MNRNTPQRGYGARTPQKLEWQNGKTDASIEFVQRATNYIVKNRQTLKLEQINLLEQAIAQIKSGELTFLAYVQPEAYLNRDL